MKSHASGRRAQAKTRTSSLDNLKRDTGKRVGANQSKAPRIGQQAEERQPGFHLQDA